MPPFWGWNGFTRSRSAVHSLYVEGFISELVQHCCGIPKMSCRWFPSTAYLNHSCQGQVCQDQFKTRQNHFAIRCTAKPPWRCEDAMFGLNQRQEDVFIVYSVYPCLAKETDPLFGWKPLGSDHDIPWPSMTYPWVYGSTDSTGLVQLLKKSIQYAVYVLKCLFIIMKESKIRILRSHCTID